MRKKRKQNGYIFKARGYWHVRYFEDRMVEEPYVMTEYLSGSAK